MWYNNDSGRRDCKLFLSLETNLSFIRQAIKAMKNKSGFTLIELLIVVAIIGILAAVILVSVNQSRKNARVNGAKTSLKTALPIIIACLDSGGTANVPNASGGNQICSTVAGSNWSVLINNYQYKTVNFTNSNACNFTVSTNNDTPADLTCDCASQICK